MFCGAILWNNLPKELTTANCLGLFKRGIGEWFSTPQRLRMTDFGILAKYRLTDVPNQKASLLPPPSFPQPTHAFLQAGFPS